jgi:hypothetical protein
MNARSRPREPFNMKTFDMGGPRVDIDNIAEALAYAEGEGFNAEPEGFLMCRCQAQNECRGQSLPNPLGV